VRDKEDKRALGESIEDRLKAVARKAWLARRLKSGMLRLGYDIKPVEKKWGVATQWIPGNMRKRRLAPATVIDVGAGRGTHQLYEAFPDAYQVLVEPLQEFEHHLEKILTQYRGEYLLTAVGSADGEVTIGVNEGCLFSSSIKGIEWYRPNPQAPVVERKVPMTTLDKLYEQRRWTPPFGLKIDVEGFEDHVIRGAEKLLTETQFVIAEVSVAERFTDSYTFAEFVSMMDERGFVVCDVLDAPRPRRDRELWFMDLMFWRKDSLPPTPRSRGPLETPASTGES
jgi:FkbM family methyltransferase